MRASASPKRLVVVDRSCPRCTEIVNFGKLSKRDFWCDRIAAHPTNVRLKCDEGPIVCLLTLD